MLVGDANEGLGTDLVSRIAAGDDEAEREFVERYQRGVRWLVRRYCRPRDPIVEDLTQEVLTNVIMRLRSGALRDAVALPAYLRSAVIRTTNAEYRKRRPEDPEDTIERFGGGETPFKQLAADQLKQMLRTVLAELPIPRDRKVIEQFYLDELDKDEVCERLGIDSGHFHRVVFRARERLRGLLVQAGIEGF